jgi:hypothetical protein
LNDRPVLFRAGEGPACRDQPAGSSGFYLPESAGLLNPSSCPLQASFATSPDTACIVFGRAGAVCSEKVRHADFVFEKEQLSGMLEKAEKSFCKATIKFYLFENYPGACRKHFSEE